MSLLINNNYPAGLQALAKVLQYPNSAASPSTANTNVQKPNWQNIQSQSWSSQTSSNQSNSGLNVTYSYRNVIKTDLSLVGPPATDRALPADGSGAVSTVTSGYDLTASDVDNS